MITANGFTSKVLAFNFLPSYTLHPSRLSLYASSNVMAVLKKQRSWSEACHRHLSNVILKSLDLGTVSDTKQTGLAIGLLSMSALEKMVRFVGVSVYAQPIKNCISGSKVRDIQACIGNELLDYARRRAGFYSSQLECLSMMRAPGNLSDVESMGYGTILKCIRTTEEAIAKRIELKMPLAIDESCSPLSTDQAWWLCMEILKDMDPVWCSSFHEAR
jgi:type III secretion protein K